MKERLISSSVLQYVVDHLPEVHSVYKALEAETRRATTRPQMMAGPVQGRLLKLLARMTRASSALEIGTFTGYSSLWMAEGMEEGGRLITIEQNPAVAQIARRFWDMAPWGGKIELRLGAALEQVRLLEDPLDLVLIDADKENNINYWEAVVPLMRPNGVVVVDNALVRGQVVEENPESVNARLMKEFNDHVARDERMETMILTIRDGLIMGVKRG